MKSGIYSISRKDCDKEYIGSAVYFNSRWAQHRFRLRNGNHHSPHLQAAWNKHGEDMFEFRILEYVDDLELLIEKEQFWLDSRNPFYNTAKVAGSQKGHTMSAEGRAKVSAIHKGTIKGPRSQEIKDKISKANTGRKLSEEHKEKLRRAKIGKVRGPYSEEHKAKIGKGNLEAWKRKKSNDQVPDRC